MPFNKKPKNRRPDKPADNKRTKNSGRTKYTGHPKRADQSKNTTYPKKAGYSKNTGYPKRADRSENAEYPKKTRYTKNMGYSKDSGYPKKADQSKNDRFPKKAGYTKNTGYPRRADHTKNEEPPQKTGFNKNNGYSKDSGYAKKADHSKNTGYPKKADHAKNTGYPKKSGDIKNPRYPKESGYSKSAGNTNDERQSKVPGRTSEIRLNKYIANAGICSRRQADLYILAGLVSVNGRVIDKLGIKVMSGDKVSFNKKIIRDEKKVYILMNKPKDCVTTVEDPGAKITVMDILGRKFAERIYPVGRLDRNTTGVLLLTNDGELTQRLTHPSYNKKKIYHVFLDKNFVHGDLVKLAKGITLDDGFIRPDEVDYAGNADKSQVGIEIHSGRNRIVRRIFEALGYRIVKLDRVYFAGLTKKGLNRGQWRFLTDREIKMLKTNAYE